MMEELGRQRRFPSCEPLHLFHLHGKTVIFPVLDHHDYQFDNRYPWKSSRNIRTPFGPLSEAQDRQLQNYEKF
jgi:hypothetical protein